MEISVQIILTLAAIFLRRLHVDSQCGKVLGVRKYQANQIFFNLKFFLACKSCV
jgi:hypothetical protein